MCEPGVFICGRVKAEDTRGPDFVSTEVMEEVMGKVGTNTVEEKQEKDDGDHIDFLVNLHHPRFKFDTNF